MPSKPPPTQSLTVQLALKEKEILKAILEFLEIRGLHITQLSLERETGVINGKYSDDLLFLRQLILDGQWDNALDFVDPLKSVQDFDFRQFRYLVTKYKFFELLCVKLEPGPLHDNDFAVEELVECLKDLEHICPTPEDYRQLCALLTLPKLSDHADFKNWNPSSARVECFHKVQALVAHLLPPTGKGRDRQDENHSSHDRLISLVAKGVFYEGCVDYCQAQAIGDMKGIENGPHPTDILANRPRLSSTDLSLISWLEMVGREQFAMPFQQKQLDLKVEHLKKPKLEAQWTETILATPMKPGGHFPHSMIPNAKLKFAEKMSQSMTMLPLTTSMSASAFPTVGRLQPMSQSTAAGFCLGIGDAGSEAMAQSQLIDTLMESSQLTKSSRPDMQRSVVMPNQMTASIAPQVVGPAMAHSYMNGMYDFTPVRRQLDEMTRRFLTFQMQMPAPIPTALPASMAPMVHQGSPRPHSTVGGPTVMSPPMPPAAMPPRPMSMPPNGTSGSPVQFEPVCRYEDTQAIRAVAFHPTGRYFAVGTNSKQLHICKYPDIRRLTVSDQVRHPEILLSRPKQHRGTSLLVSGGAGNCQLHVTDCHTGQLIQSLRGHSAPILGLFTWNSGPLFVSCSQDKTIRFWDVRSSQAVNVIQPTSKTHSAPVTSVCVDPSGQLLVSGHEDASVALYDITGGRILQTYR
ncbi:WD domain, G-beta repeat protein [Ancylostoma duodenale]|uniref:WD domain, G-beta repeat protein n=1 Tax=Ancylostoma duodenale TaxID=51022 RepID=A0A0C2D0G9_9BILA|nr:WD domain, G-beta repeat protein [Ancylostoma duodenale]